MSNRMRAGWSGGMLGFVLTATGCADGDVRFFDEVDAVGQRLPKDAGGTNGEADFCTGGSVCLVGEGDCDRNSECAPGLVCGVNNGSEFGMPANYDVCACPVLNLAAPRANFCSTACPCEAGEGDCDRNAECAPGLVCGTDNGADFGFPDTYDVCTCPTFDPSKPRTAFCSTACPCEAGEGDCDRNAECGPGLVCGTDNGATSGLPPNYDVCTCPTFDPSKPRAAFCSTACPCEGGEGDCDGDAECAPGLVCGTDNGADFGLPDTYDVCTCPTFDPSEPNAAFCSAACPCEAGEGNCDGDEECGPGLVCGTENGAIFGLPANYDVCGCDSNDDCDELAGETCDSSTGACGIPSSAKLLVVAPHPDDDIIIASGQLFRAVQQEVPFLVVFVTNGDFDGVARGYERQNEAIDALAALGVAEDNAIFLGYPDAYLASLFYDYPDEDDVVVTPNNGVSATYGARGLGSADYHTYRFGQPADYNGANFVSDLADIIDSYRPQYIILTSEYDVHEDHATCFDAVKAAALRVRAESPDFAPVMYKTVVWTSAYSGWPQPIDPTAYTEMPAIFYEPPPVWSDRTSIDQPPELQTTSYESNPKYVALREHNDGDGLLQYIHKDEFYWTETLDGVTHAPIVDAGLDQTVSAGELVQLDGTQSRDPDEQPLSYEWVQRRGTVVQLSDSAAAAPVFTAPSGAPTDEVLYFELRVSDGDYTSLADSVQIVVTGSSGSPNSDSVAQ